MARLAAHSGTWYSSDAKVLDQELAANLEKVPLDVLPIHQSATDGKAVTYPVPGARAIIAPHAGYSYSGPTAAWAYKALDWSQAKRIFILGPAHHESVSGGALTVLAEYATPFGKLSLDVGLIDTLANNSKLFEPWNGPEDEEEHSIEMHLPYIYKMLKETGRLNEVKLVPIIIGHAKQQTEVQIGKVLSQYISDSGNFFVISSDFCHWGRSFRFQPGLKASETSSKENSREIYEHIDELDHECMRAIESGSSVNFHETIKKNQNTVCGRHPISVMMNAIEEWRKTETGSDEKGFFQFTQYRRSSQVRKREDSSVSYCSAFAVF